MKTRQPIRQSASGRYTSSRANLSGFATLFSLSVGLVACGEEFDPGTQVDSLRVLAVQVDSPFAAPGDTVRLEALSHDPEARPIEWAWAACENPASSSVEGCLIDIAEEVATTGASPLIMSGEGLDSIEFTIPTTALDGVSEAARSQAVVGVLSIACPGTISLAGATETNPGDNPPPHPLHRRRRNRARPPRLHRRHQARLHTRNRPQPKPRHPEHHLRRRRLARNGNQRGRRLRHRRIFLR